MAANHEIATSIKAMLVDDSPVIRFAKVFLTNTLLLAMASSYTVALQFAKEITCKLT